MHYRRMPIEVESPEEVGYATIRYNLAESSLRDRTLGALGIAVDLESLVLCYGDHRGHPGLRALLAAEAGVAPEGVLLTSGAAGALFLIATAILGEGDHLVVVRPNYATNLETPRAIGCRTTYIDLTFAGGWQIDVDQVAAAIDPQTRLISLTTPHNPSGVIVPEATLRALHGLAEAAGAFLLVDETYRDLTHGEPPPPATTLGPRVISVASLSKAYGLPGLRAGWLCAHDPALLTDLLAAKEQVQICGATIEEEIAYQVIRRRAALLPGLRGEALEALATVRAWIDGDPRFAWRAPGGGVVAFPRLADAVDVEAFYRELAAMEAMVGPGHWFEQDRRYFRLGFGWPTPAELAGGLERLSDAAARARR